MQHCEMQYTRQKVRSEGGHKQGAPGVQEATFKLYTRARKVGDITKAAIAAPRSNIPAGAYADFSTEVP